MLSVPPLSFAKKPLASTMSQPTPSAIFERPLPPACLVRLTVAFLVSEIVRSEEHTSELQSLMRISYAVFCLKKKKTSEGLLTATHNVSIKKEQTNAINTII